jgi:hypothetical protein
MAMFSRVTFLVFLVFWLTMTYLLWRSEYAVQNQGGSAVPVSLVWRKILNAPDSSSLQVLHLGRKMGYCRWSSSIGQDLVSSEILTEDSWPAQKSAGGARGPQLDLEGNVLISEDMGRLQIHGILQIETNNDWQEFDLRFALKPDSWEIHSRATDQTVRVKINGEQGNSVRVISFADFRDPQALLRDFGVPMPLVLPGMMNLPGLAQKPSASAIGLKWTARNDWIFFAHTPVRAFRLEAAVLERYRVRIIVSAAGEILRVDLPDGWMLINDHLTNL